MSTPRPEMRVRAATKDIADSLRLVVTQKGEVTLQIINLVLVEVRFRA